MGEAVVVGAAGGLLGLVAGVGAALGLRALVANLGVTVTDSSLVITGRTILVAVTVLLGVTLLAGGPCPPCRASRPRRGVAGVDFRDRATRESCP